MKNNLFYLLFTFGLVLSIEAQSQISYADAFPNVRFNFPVEIQASNDGTNRLFVVEQPGKIKVLSNNSDISSAFDFIDLSEEVSFSVGQEVGLLGLAFHPKYKENGYFFVYVTKYNPANNNYVDISLIRYQAESENPNKANELSRKVIFSFSKNINSSNHNGGKIIFGGDGYLYVSIGDGGGNADPFKNAQNLNVPFGSILRIDIDVDGNNPIENNPDSPQGNYEIPSDNPLRGKSGLEEIYAWGLRNTWKFSIDYDTDRIWGADVGQKDFEEINLIQKGGNYGWNRFEANSIENASTDLISEDIRPIFSYNHDNGDVSITGGYVYKGSIQDASIKNKYVFGDYVSGRVWALSYDEDTNSATSKLLFRTNGEYISSFGEDEYGDLFFSSYGESSKLYKIVDESGSSEDQIIAVDGVGYWNDIFDDINGIVEDVKEHNNQIYACGLFTSKGNSFMNNIARYTKGIGWEALSSGSNGEIVTLAFDSENNLYAGGNFTEVGGVEANNIAMWDGIEWRSLGEGVDGSVAAISIDSNDNLYVGGGFITAGQKAVNNIAIWKNEWFPLMDENTTKIGTNNEVRSIAIDSDDKVYVGGNFAEAGGKAANRFAVWNNNSWDSFGSGTSGFVEAILPTEDFIYICGNFSLAGESTVNRIARWNISSQVWEPLGEGINGNGNTLVTDGVYIYVGGNFTTAANNPNVNYLLNYVGRWSEATGWQALGEGKLVGLNNLVNTLYFSVKEQVLYVAGNFDYTGSLSTGNIAKWAEQPRCGISDIDIEYKIDETWSSGLNLLKLEGGTSITLSILQDNFSFDLLLPGGEIVEGDYFIENFDENDVGTYVFMTDNDCRKEITLEFLNDCEDGAIANEYKIDGVWDSSEEEIIMELGQELIISMLPNGMGLNITKPNGEVVGDNYRIDSFNNEDVGLYTLLSENGCSSELNVVLDSGINCPYEIIPEYRINDTWLQGSEKIIVDEGQDMRLSMLPNGIGLNITLPNGDVVNDDFDLLDFSSENQGTYIITTEDGCVSYFEIEIENFCEDAYIVPEYRLNGSWFYGNNNLEIEEGTEVMLSMLPNKRSSTIILPDGTIVFDNYDLGKVDLGDSGVYYITDESGCKEQLNITVYENENCLEEDTIPEYRINGNWNSGQNFIQINEGDDITLSILPNGVNLNIILPNGTGVGDNYYIPNVSTENAGLYKLEPEFGCAETLQIFVVKKEEAINLTYESKKRDIVLYPNPTIDKTTLDLNGIGNGKMINLVLYDFSLKQLDSNVFGVDHTGLIDFTLENYPEGIYFVTIIVEDGEKFTKRLIKKN